jgi:hypothetical protein
MDVHTASLISGEVRHRNSLPTLLQKLGASELICWSEDSRLPQRYAVSSGKQLPTFLPSTEKIRGMNSLFKADFEKCQRPSLAAEKNSKA